jgi:hypothetical protein
MTRAGVAGRLTVTPVAPFSGRSRTRIPGGEAESRRGEGRREDEAAGRAGETGVGRGDWSRADD